MSEVPPPVDTLHAPHEPVVPAPSSAWLWVAVLGGPVVWFAHFMAVYLVAEAVCTPGRVGGEQPWSDATLNGFVVGATIVAVVLCVAGGVYAWRLGRSGDAGLTWVGVPLAIGSAAAIVAVGLPVLMVGPC